MKSSLEKIPFCTAATYFIIASLYILLSDYLFSNLFPTLEELAIAQTFKGLGFVLITGVILFLDLRNRIAAIRREREKAEREHTAREQSEVNYRNMAKYSPFAKFVTLDGKIVYLNQACVSLFGIDSPEEAIGQSALDYFHQDFHELIQERMAELTTVGQSVPSVQEKLVRADGSLIDVEASASMFPFGKQNAVHMILRDITDEVAARDKIDFQLQQLHALYQIDQAILTHYDLSTVLEICLKLVMNVLAVDGAGIILRRAEEINAEPFHGVGIASRVEEETGAAARDLRFQEFVGDRRQVFFSDLVNLSEGSISPVFNFGERFGSYCGLPLIAKDKVEGVLELYNISPMNPSEDWFTFLNTISSQIALVVEDMQYYEGMRKTLVNLERAYDKTIEGWSKAMGLRDWATEDHTQRVTEITLELAQRFGFKEENLKYVRWGSQLHDMGKLGIPDDILLKPGKLTPEEWEIMRQHPQYAFDMLEPIDYLKPALDIPYYHHEKWDGTGYPNGLKGQNIPLAARIFAVVDVWDALSSDRPYRPKWPQDRIMGYIKEQVGQHFDPAVVNAFMDYMEHDYQGGELD